ncbi:hypothetical protein [Kribbella karoonensis]|uniref:Uncharacterized protein n=1 Tax=Kribbella karoonensis TaxID=324851 RepID=A0ABP4QJR9_9ACTN
MEVQVAGLVGIYADPRHVIAYSDGEVRQQFNICVAARSIGGTLQGSAESTDQRYVDPSQLGELPMHPTRRLRLEHFLDTSWRQPYVG